MLIFLFMLELALPVVISYLGLMTMGLVDLMFVGKISAAALGAVGVGTAIFSWFMVFGLGLLTSLDYFISHAYGAGEKDQCHLWWCQGFWLSWLLGIPATFALFMLSHHLTAFGINPEVLQPSSDYLGILSLSLIPVYLFSASRQYLQAMGVAKTVAVILLAANVFNFCADYVFVLGHFGAPALGAKGAAIATLLARIFMVLAVIGAHLLQDRSPHRFFARLGVPFRPHFMKKVIVLGFPSALQLVFEVGVFAFTTTLAARLSSQALAAHQIVLSVASMTFMVPLGVSSATAVLVGRDIGRGSREDAAKTGWKGVMLGTGFMALSSIVLLTFSIPFIEFYTMDVEVRKTALEVLFIAAVFQLSDGAQTVTTGALRGLADTRTPMVANLIGHWVVGLPVGVYLCFVLGKGLPGLWTGLALGLTVVAGSLLWQWTRLSAHSS